jgi:tripeptide aminopeptidase
MEDLVRWVQTIAETPAPTFAEARRAELLCRLFRAQGQAPEVDAAGNVLCRLGPSEGRPVVFAAHLDTVFPDEEIRTTVAGEWLSGPGVADDAAGLALLVDLAGHLAGASLRRPVWLLADVGEEGLGDLRGVKAFLDAHPFVAAFVSLDGQLGSVVRQAIGVRRLEVTVEGPGGHSWGDYGRPSAVHALVEVLAAATALPVPRRPRSSLNIGLIAGGTSVNSIAAHARALIDLRSVSATTLDRLEGAVRSRLATVPEGLRLTVQVVGDRPAGSLPAEHPLVAAALAALRAVGIEGRLAQGSTDANAPLARGIPGICFGVVTGRGAHTTAEALWIPSLQTGRDAVRRLAELLAGEVSPVIGV